MAANDYYVYYQGPAQWFLSSTKVYHDYRHAVEACTQEQAGYHLPFEVRNFPTRHLPPAFIPVTEEDLLLQPDDSFPRRINHRFYLHAECCVVFEAVELVLRGKLEGCGVTMVTIGEGLWRVQAPHLGQLLQALRRISNLNYIVTNVVQIFSLE